MLGLPTRSGSGDGEEERRQQVVQRRCGGGVEGMAGNSGGCFGTVLEWFWEHKIHGQNTKKNVWKMEDDEFFLLFKK